MSPCRCDRRSCVWFDFNSGVWAASRRFSFILFLRVVFRCFEPVEQRAGPGCLDSAPRKLSGLNRGRRSCECRRRLRAEIGFVRGAPIMAQMRPPLVVQQGFRMPTGPRWDSLFNGLAETEGPFRAFQSRLVEAFWAPALSGWGEKGKSWKVLRHFPCNCGPFTVTKASKTYWISDPSHDFGSVANFSWRLTGI